MGGSEAVRIDSVSRNTPGQITWHWLNRIIDIEERERRIHLRCLPKWKETLCEVCGKPVDLLHDYAALLSDKIERPRDYIEAQLHMTEEEKAARTVFFTELFEKNAPQPAKETSGNDL